MDGWEFEEYCASILRKNGFSHVEVTQGSGDFGIDVIAEKAGVPGRQQVHVPQW